MPNFRAINSRMSRAKPDGPYHGYGGQYGYAAGSPFGRTRWLPLLPGAKKDWETEAKDLDRNSAVAACLGWFQDNFISSRLEVHRYQADGSDDPIPDHPVLVLLGPHGRPNPDYTLRTLWAAMILSWKVDGNVFLLKGRGSGGAGPTKALWWEPHFNVTPWHQTGDERLVSWYYVSRPEGLYRVDPTDIIHIRDSIDKFNPMLGVSRLKAGIRSIVGQNNAETYSASVVGNMGGISVLWSPEGGEPVDENEAREVARILSEGTSQENAGRIKGVNIPGKIDRLALSPEEMALESIPDRFEAMICALLGINPMVVGLAVGAQMRSYANQQEADAQSWHNGLIPAQDAIAEGLGPQILPDLGPADDLFLAWDRSRVVALQKSSKEKADEAVALFTGDIATRDEARARADLPPAKVGGDQYASTARAAAEPDADEADGGGDSTKAFDDLEDFDWDDPDLLGDMIASGVDPDGADAIKAARQAKLKKDPHTGQFVSHHSKTGNPACSAAVSAWRRKQATHETFAQLAVCRQMAKGRRQAELSRAAGHEARAQHLEHRSSRLGGPKTARERSSRARELAHGRAVDRKVQQAYLRLSGGRSNHHVGLADLREGLPQLSRAEVDASLRRLERGRAALYPHNDPRRITPRDRAAALATPSGDERHIIYLGARGGGPLSPRQVADLMTDGRRSPSAPTRPTTGSSSADRIYAAMHQLEPQANSGALVSVRELRRHLGNPPDFDARILRLADEGKIALHHTDAPPGEDVSGLIADRQRKDHAGRPSHVIGIARR